MDWTTITLWLLYMMVGIHAESSEVLDTLGAYLPPSNSFGSLKPQDSFQDLSFNLPPAPASYSKETEDSGDSERTDFTSFNYNIPKSIYQHPSSPSSSEEEPAPSRTYDSPQSLSKVTKQTSGEDPSSGTFAISQYSEKQQVVQPQGPICILANPYGPAPQQVSQEHDKSKEIPNYGRTFLAHDIKSDPIIVNEKSSGRITPASHGRPIDTLAKGGFLASDDINKPYRSKSLGAGQQQTHFGPIKTNRPQNEYKAPSRGHQKYGISDSDQSKEHSVQKPSSSRGYGSVSSEDNKYDEESGESVFIGYTAPIKPGSSPDSEESDYGKPVTTYQQPHKKFDTFGGLNQAGSFETSSHEEKDISQVYKSPATSAPVYESQESSLEKPTSAYGVPHTGSVPKVSHKSDSNKYQQTVTNHFGTVSSNAKTPTHTAAGDIKEYMPTSIFVKSSKVESSSESKPKYGAHKTQVDVQTEQHKNKYGYERPKAVHTSISKKADPESHESSKEQSGYRSRGHHQQKPSTPARFGHSKHQHKTSSKSSESSAGYGVHKPKSPDTHGNFVKSGTAKGTPKQTYSSPHQTHTESQESVETPSRTSEHKQTTSFFNVPSVAYGKPKTGHKVSSSVFESKGDSSSGDDSYELSVDSQEEPSSAYKSPPKVSYQTPDSSKKSPSSHRGQGQGTFSHSSQRGSSSGTHFKANNNRGYNTKESSSEDTSKQSFTGFNSPNRGSFQAGSPSYQAPSSHGDPTSRQKFGTLSSLFDKSPKPAGHFQAQSHKTTESSKSSSLGSLGSSEETGTASRSYKAPDVSKESSGSLGYQGQKSPSSVTHGKSVSTEKVYSKTGPRLRPLTISRKPKPSPTTTHKQSHYSESQETQKPQTKYQVPTSVKSTNSHFSAADSSKRGGHSKPSYEHDKSSPSVGIKVTGKDTSRDSDEISTDYHVPKPQSTSHFSKSSEKTVSKPTQEYATPDESDEFVFPHRKVPGRKHHSDRNKPSQTYSSPSDEREVGKSVTSGIRKTYTQPTVSDTSSESHSDSTSGISKTYKQPSAARTGSQAHSQSTSGISNTYKQPSADKPSSRLHSKPTSGINQTYKQPTAGTTGSQTHSQSTSGISRTYKQPASAKTSSQEHSQSSNIGKTYKQPASAKTSTHRQSKPTSGINQSYKQPTAGTTGSQTHSQSTSGISRTYKQPASAKTSSQEHSQSSNIGKTYKQPASAKTSTHRHSKPTSGPSQTYKQPTAAKTSSEEDSQSPSNIGKTYKQPVASGTKTGAYSGASKTSSSKQHGGTVVSGGEAETTTMKMMRPYDFEWEVLDPDTQNDFGQKASSDGMVETGQYHVLLPDGRKQVVKYLADWETGFHVDVTYEGEKHEDQYKES